MSFDSLNAETLISVWMFGDQDACGLFVRVHKILSRSEAQMLSTCTCLQKAKSLSH